MAPFEGVATDWTEEGVIRKVTRTTKGIANKGDTRRTTPRTMVAGECGNRTRTMRRDRGGTITREEEEEGVVDTTTGKKSCGVKAF